MLIYGTGEHAKVVYDCLCDNQTDVGGFFDDNINKKDFFGKPVLKYDPDRHATDTLIIAIGNNASRMKVARSVSHGVATAIHKSGIVSKAAIINEGCMIMQGAVVQIDTKLGKHVIINTAASVDHDCNIGDYVHIAPNSTLCGNVRIGEGTLIGSGSTVIPGITIGKWCVIGAGSVIIEDIPDYSLVVGNPGRIIRKLK